MLRFLTVIFIILSSWNLMAQNWRKSSFDLSISSVGLNNKIHEQRINEFLNIAAYNKFIYEKGKKIDITPINSNFPSITFINFNYVMKQNTNVLFFRQILFTSGININITDGASYVFSIKDTSSNYYNKIKGSFSERKKGMGINLSLSLLSKPFLKFVKFKVEILNSFSPYSIIKYSSSTVDVSQNIYGDRYSFYGDALGNNTNHAGKLMNNTQLKAGLRFNVDCTGNVFINYITNYTIYRGKPDIKYTGFSHGIEFGINFLLTNEGESLDSPSVFW